MKIYKMRNLSKLRQWIIIQKYSLQRGYAWLQIPMLGVIFASSIKAAFPGFIGSLNMYIILIILSFVALYFVGWLDKRFKFLDEENNYITITNPTLMAGLRGELKNAS